MGKEIHAQQRPIHAVGYREGPDLEKRRRDHSGLVTEPHMLSTPAEHREDVDHVAGDSFGTGISCDAKHRKRMLI